MEILYEKKQQQIPSGINAEFINIAVLMKNSFEMEKLIEFIK